MTTTAPAIRERPLLFSAPMVRALLAGTKTQTRRIVKLPRWVKTSGDRRDAMRCLARQRPVLGLTERGPCDGARTWRCPYGVPGDRMWVRETHAIESWCHDYGTEPPLPTDRPWKHRHFEEIGDYWYWAHYCATDPPPELGCESERCRPCAEGEPSPHWKPSIHMPRWASRMSLELTDVRVQRLQEISEDDARAEGIRWTEGGPLHAHIGLSHVGGDECNFPTAVAAYGALWEDINGGGSWDANPWVWALTFKRVTA